MFEGNIPTLQTQLKSLQVRILIVRILNVGILKSSGEHLHWWSRSWLYAWLPEWCGDPGGLQLIQDPIGVAGHLEAKHLSQASPGQPERKFLLPSRLATWIKGNAIFVFVTGISFLLTIL